MTKRKKIILLTSTLCFGIIILFYLGIILKNPFKSSLCFNKLSLKRNNVEVIKTAINNIKDISLKDSITDYKLYDYVYSQTKNVQNRFFLIDYWNYGLLDEDEYYERISEISISLSVFFNESPSGEEYLKQKINSVSDTNEKIGLLNFLFVVYSFKNKLDEFIFFINNINDADEKMKKYIEKAKLDTEDNGIRRLFGY